MEQHFIDRFIDDALDLVAQLEQNLLTLEKSPQNKESIESVFRAMHSLKGTSSMYGFDAIEELTHHVETLYDELRREKRKVNHEIISGTLKVIDIIKEILQNPNQEIKETQKYQDVFTEITELIGRTLTLEKTDDSSNSPAETDNAQKITATYLIHFFPDRDIFTRGINIFALIEELADIGSVKIVANKEKIPLLEDFDPTLCYLSWHIYLATDASQNDIEDVFIFVENEFDIKKIADEDILDSADIEKHRPKSKKEEKISITTENAVPGLDETPDDFEADKTIKTLIKKQITSNIKVSADKLDELMKLVSELVVTKAELNLIAEKNTIAQLSRVSEKIDKLSRGLRDNALSIRLIPIENMMLRFKRYVRDLSIELNKDVEFITEGTSTELDKSIIDNLSNPLMHIIRNSIDHGLETAEQRKKIDKTGKGLLKFTAFYAGANVFIQIQDDGAGINLEKVRKIAIKKGYISSDDKLSQKETIALIFHPGFTTADNVSEVSGRGVGLDVVKQRIAELQGTIEVDTEKNLGTTFTIKLPQTLSIVDALLVKIDISHFLIPLSNVESCHQVVEDDAQLKNNRIILDNEMYPCINLRKELDINNHIPDKQKVVLINSEEKRVALLVDSVIGEYQAVQKPLADIFKFQQTISGASILGDGSVALILDVNMMIKQKTEK